LKNKEILLATKNKNKIRELKILLSPLQYQIFDASTLPYELEEKGKTFCENAVSKAKFYAEKCNMTALSDDSGLMVDALNGRPGILSSRYVGNDKENRKRLLEEMKHLKHLNQRKAHFVCCVAIVTKKRKIYTIQELCEGYIALEERGDGGFGYDPVFIPQGLDKTFAENPEIKEEISHRAKAIKKIINLLKRIENEV
jgi:XTP/dITP diphosphohydrolase